MSSPIIPVEEATAFAHALLSAIGVRGEIATATAETLVEGDLLGHRTHGLGLLPRYLDELRRGSMRRSGEPAVLRSRYGNALWDGDRLPGPWLVRKAADTAMELARAYGTSTIVIRNSHHIACLAVYARRIADSGLLGLISTSDPGAALVAPHGGRTAIITPNPIAAGIPAEPGNPILVDVSTSATSRNEVMRRQRTGEPFAFECLVDSAGKPTNDPHAMTSDNQGAILPLGGVALGHKGYGLGLIVESLTGGLSGGGRSTGAKGWGANVFVQVMDPAAFAGGDEFGREMRWVAAACRRSPPQAASTPVRLPGEAGLARRREQLAAGLQADPATLAGLADWGRRLGVELPAWAVSR